MGQVIVIEFLTLDGVMEDPDGSEGFPAGGWAFRHGPEAVAGDKFRLRGIFDTGALLLGRRTWQLFAGLWPARDDPFSQRMNAIPKLVVSRTLLDVDTWVNSSVLHGDLLEEVAARRADRDLVVAGSASVAHALMRAELVDEYRLLVFPSVLGRGVRLFAEGLDASDLELVSVERSGAAVLSVHRRAAPRATGL